MSSELLKVHRLMQDLDLLNRVQGASIKHAAALLKTGATGADRKLAERVRDDPFGEVRELRTAVVLDPDVQAASTIDDTGTPDSSAVPDDAIEAVVNGAWSDVAAALYSTTA